MGGGIDIDLAIGETGANFQCSICTDILEAELKT